MTLSAQVPAPLDAECAVMCFVLSKCSAKVLRDEDYNSTEHAGRLHFAVSKG